MDFCRSHFSMGNQSEAAAIDLEEDSGTPMPKKAVKKVFVLYTGGTIGMVRNEKGALVPAANKFTAKVKTSSVLNDEELAKEKRKLGLPEDLFVLPHSSGRHLITYKIKEFDPLFDSSDISMTEWIRIGNEIKNVYEYFDGFVILHGTDTLTYTASALSFMFEDLGKSVIITGSQIPLFDIRGDGRENFLESLILAASYIIPEVTVFFHHKLFRGNRTVKVSTEQLNAFESFNFPPLARVGIDIQVNTKAIFRSNKISKMNVHSELSKHVGLLRISPGIPTELVQRFLQPPMEGVVLQTFGAGNVPANRADLLVELKKATDRGMIIINCTQCIEGAVNSMYATGQVLIEAGVLSGFDMTIESAISKLSYVLGKSEWDLPTKRKMMSENLRGELTITGLPPTFRLIDAIAGPLNLSTNKQQDDLKDVLYPSLISYAIKCNDLNRIEELHSLGVDLTLTFDSFDGMSALHLACREGKKEIVEYLLKGGTSVHQRDGFNRTPLKIAMINDHHHIIPVLLTAGAHVTTPPLKLGEELCSAAGRGDVTRIKSYQLAGVNLNQQDASGRTALHMATLLSRTECVSYLLKQNVDRNVPDMLGFTALDLSEKLKCKCFSKLLCDTN